VSARISSLERARRRRAAARAESSPSPRMKALSLSPRDGARAPSNGAMGRDGSPWDGMVRGGVRDVAP